VLPGVLLGIGLGGFVDGILFHQVLQWHHMVSSQACCPTSTVEGLEHNTLADGLFHLGTWLITVAGSLAVLRAWRRGELAPAWQAHVGALLLGWGLFNVLDTVNHVLGFHHIRDDLGGPVGWDVGFFVFALALVAAGWALARGPEARHRTSRPN